MDSSGEGMHVRVRLRRGLWLMAISLPPSTRARWRGERQGDGRRSPGALAHPASSSWLFHCRLSSSTSVELLRSSRSVVWLPPPVTVGVLASRRCTIVGLVRAGAGCGFAWGRPRSRIAAHAPPAPPNHSQLSLLPNDIVFGPLPSLSLTACAALLDHPPTPVRLCHSHLH